MSRVSLGVMPCVWMVQGAPEGVFAVRFAETTAEAYCASCGGSGMVPFFAYDAGDVEATEPKPSLVACSCTRSEAVDAAFTLMAIGEDVRTVMLHATAAGVLDRVSPHEGPPTCKRTALGTYEVATGITKLRTIQVVADERPGNVLPRRW